MEIRHFSTYDYKSQGSSEIPVGFSKTEPDMSYSIKELLLRFGVGNTPPVSRAVFYDADDVSVDDALNNISPSERPDFDLADAYSLSQELAENRRRHLSARENFRKQNDSVLSNNATTTNDDATITKEVPSDLPSE